MKKVIYTTTGLIVLTFWLYNIFYIAYNSTINQLKAQATSFTTNKVVMPSPNPSFIPTKQLGPLTQAATPAPTTDTQAWGTTKQLDAHTFVVKVGDDPTMATPQDIFIALNAYRAKNGSGLIKPRNRCQLLKLTSKL